jgi:SpoIID/LytB domain protein
MMIRRRCRSVVVAIGAVALVVGSGVSPAGAAAEVSITGHGWGHGRGMSQWGALGYAVDHGWTAQQILDHYYGGTVAGQAGNPTIGVELLGLGGKDLIATAQSLTVGGTQVPGDHVLLRRNGDGSFTAFASDSCGGPWAAWQSSVGSGTVASSSASAADPANHVQICEADQVRGYRGDLQVVDTGSSSAVVNRVPLEDYLRGVLPREVLPSWAGEGGGRGAQALQAQAVAARSYAIASPRSSYATTCDTTACQVYGGEYTRPQDSSTRTSLEDSRTDAAVAATAGTVRTNRAGAVSRTEFSSSSGGWTAGGDFPAVEDLGDTVAGNPNHDWSASVGADVLAERLGTGAITGITVTERNGHGADGGRVLKVVVKTDDGERSFTGNQFRSLAQLKSDWFSID